MPSIAIDSSTSDGTRPETNAVAMNAVPLTAAPTATCQRALAGAIGVPRGDDHAGGANQVGNRAEQADLKRRALEGRLQDLREEEPERIERHWHHEVDEREHPQPRMAQRSAHCVGATVEGRARLGVKCRYERVAFARREPRRL